MSKPDAKPGPRLTESQVREIRKSAESISELSRRYGVSRMTIRDIRRRTRYGKVKD
jgi:transposase-like protein